MENKTATNQPTASAAPGQPQNLKKNATTGMILGIIGLLAWLLPFIGYPVTIVGLVLSIRGLKSTKQKQAIAGIIMNGIGLVATVVNSVIGAYLGATGQL
ncbi:MAG: hypothetical protein WCV50_06125 [Patescibacteria group bacterium]|jgi:hypothetical protein